MPDDKTGLSLPDLLIITELCDTFANMIVIPANAGTQRRSMQDTGFPLSRE
jgi:hypothetical protein